MAPRLSKQHTPSQALATIPDEVPELPASFQARPELSAALKASVLSSKAGVSGSHSATTVTAPPRRSAAAHTTTTSGMGGVGKTMMAAALARDPEVNY